RYLALGDSLSQGVGVPDEATGSFPALLAEEWRADGCTVEIQNAGISGWTAAQIITDELPQIEDFDPTVITFQGGGNDIANGVTIDQYRTDVGTVLDAAVDSGARVLVLYQNEWFRSPVGVDYGDIEPQREDFDEVLAEEAEARGAEMIDLREMYAQEADDELWVEDGLHPTPEVYASWATAIADAAPAPC
ncbi:MAG TPA: GDSL-type esterase/lipase family protein, partial [Iamia sp.]|nr:GDSL-type esterase/lipase family protein [Iamia sp.]